MKLLSLIVALTLSAITFGQLESFSTTEVELYNGEEIVQMDQWTTYIENASFKIEYIKTFCDVNSGPDFNAIQMRFTNLTSQDLTLGWHINLDYNGSCKTCASDEYERYIDLSANQIVETTCETDEFATYRLFDSFDNKKYSRAKLTAFKLNELLMQINN